MTTPITSKGFTIVPPVREDAPNVIQWKKGDEVRSVTYIAKASMGFLQRMRGMDLKIWKRIGEGDKAVYVKIEEWNRLEPAEQAKLETFFLTTFREALGLAKHVHVKLPELGREATEEEAKRVKALVKDRLLELVSAATSSPKKTSKLYVSDNVGVVRCEVSPSGSVTISAAKGGGKGSFKTMRKMIDFGSVEKIVEGNRVYAYLKLHSLKELSGQEAAARISLLREEIEVMQHLQQAGVQHVVKLYKVKTEKRMIQGKEEEVPVGIMVEWCNMGDAEWATHLLPAPGTAEYALLLGLAFDAAVGMHAIHQAGQVHGDLKAANLFLKLLHGHLSAVWGDLGGSVKAGDFLKSPSIAFLAPEQLFGSGKGKATKEGEVWSFGILLLQLFHGKESNAFAKIYPPDVFERSRSKEEIESIKRKLRGALAEVKTHLTAGNPIDDLILQCLSPVSANRPPAEAVAQKLQSLLPVPQAPTKHLSSRARARQEEAAEQQIISMKAKASAPPPPDVTIVDVTPAV